MKKFRFPLQPVARLRAHYEMRAREAFGSAVSACAEAERKHVQVIARVGAFESAVVAGRQGNFSGADEAANLGAYRDELGHEAQSAKAKAAAHVAMEQRRLEYVEAHRRLEVMKRLEAKARTEHQLELNRAEQAEFDDIASQRSARKTISIS